MAKGCMFCKIAKGKVPSYKIYENKKVIAFLDINPIAKGHTLVIPKKHFENVFDCKDKILAEMIKATQKIALHYKEKLGCTGVNILNASGASAEQQVPHLHFHIIPRIEGDGHKIWPVTEHVTENLERLAYEIKMGDELEPKKKKKTEENNG